VPLPELTLGLIVRYEYLWHRRSRTSAMADKDHPACVVATFRHHDRPGDFVVYLPISLRRRQAMRRASSFPPT
jgi:hypothetical protein